MLASKSNQREAELLLIIDEQSQQIKAQQEVIQQQQEEIEKLRTRLWPFIQLRPADLSIS